MNECKEILYIVTKCFTASFHLTIKCPTVMTSTNVLVEI
jgi:hypothetical protein